MAHDNAKTTRNVEDNLHRPTSVSLDFPDLNIKRSVYPSILHL